MPVPYQNNYYTLQGFSVRTQCLTKYTFGPNATAVHPPSDSDSDNRSSPPPTSSPLEHESHDVMKIITDLAKCYLLRLKGKIQPSMQRKNGNSSSPTTSTRGTFLPVTKVGS